MLYPVSANEPLIASKLSQLTGAEGIPATIEPGYRAVSVPITDVSGVAGLIQPGAHVDVLFTRPGTMAEAITSTILQNVKVLAIGASIQVKQVVDPKAPKFRRHAGGHTRSGAEAGTREERRPDQPDAAQSARSVERRWTAARSAPTFSTPT